MYSNEKLGPKVAVAEAFFGTIFPSFPFYQQEKFILQFNLSLVCHLNMTFFDGNIMCFFCIPSCVQQQQLGSEGDCRL